MSKYNDKVAGNATNALAGLNVIFRIVRELAILHPEIWDKLDDDPVVSRYLKEIGGNGIGVSEKSATRS